MIKKGIFCVFIAMAIAFSGFSEERIQVDGNAPKFVAKDPTAEAWHGQVDQTMEQFQHYIDIEFDNMLDGIENSANDVIPPGLIKTTGLLTGFGTSALFASHGATMWAYADYKFLSFSIGSILGIRFPDNSAGTVSDILSGKNTELNDFMNKENIIFGISPQFINLHAGIYPAAKWEIMPKNLFLGLRLGFFGLPDLEIPIGDDATADLNYSTFTIGVTANYQLVKTYDVFDGLIKWRGVNIGSGIIFQTTKFDLSVPFGKMDADMPYNGGPNDPLNGLHLQLNPKATFNMGVNTFTIPIEVSTAIKLVFLNIPFGIGFDLGFGASRISVGANSAVDFVGDNSSMIVQKEKGKLSVGIENNNVSPIPFNFKIMTGLGFTINDVFVIDMPLTFYVPDGFNFGFTMGLRL